MNEIPEDITINYIAPNGEVTDITRSVLYSDAYFESQAAAVSGSFHITVRDENRTHEFVAGGRIEMLLGTQKMFGGFLTTPTRDFFFPALDTSKPVTGRRWSLDGVDYNSLLDKRVLRNPDDYTHKIPDILTSSGNYNDAYIISAFELLNYFDLDFSGGGTIDVTTNVPSAPPINDFTEMELTGTVSKTDGDRTITGSGTLFLDELDAGNLLRIGSETRTVASVTNNTHLELKSTPTSSASGVPGYRVSRGWTWPEQGSTMRQVLDAVVIETTIYGSLACIYWLAPGAGNTASIHWLAIPSEDDEAEWGFSDVPTPDAEFPYIGWRDGAASEDGSSVINEVFIWGGSPIGSNGRIVIGHTSNATSIADHGRWQKAENHPGVDMYKSKAQVVARANALVNGSTSGTSPVTGAQGLVNPDRQYHLTWFAHDVPIVDDARQHLVPGKTVSLLLWSFGHPWVEGDPVEYEDGGFTPFIMVLPLRQVRITFPTLPSLDNPDEDPKTFVQFEGMFSLQMSDPVWWWQYLLTRRPAPQASPIVTTDNDSDEFPYGSFFTDVARETPDGTIIDFSITPTYIPGTLDVFVNGTLMTKGAQWNELSPGDEDGGSWRFLAPPAIGSVVLVSCRTG